MGLTSILKFLVSIMKNYAAIEWASPRPLSEHTFKPHSIFKQGVSQRMDHRLSFAMPTAAIHAKAWRIILCTIGGLRDKLRISGKLNKTPRLSQNLLEKVASLGNLFT
jgi:hypothetical protein